MKLVLLPPGEFDMGSAQEEVDQLIKEGEHAMKAHLFAVYIGCIRAEAPKHHVKLTKAFYFGACPVTQAEFELVMSSNPSKLHGETNPVDRVTWNEAVEFCRRLSEMPAEKAAGAVYRLPTEAEWEYACRAGTNTRYSFGDSAAEVSRYAWWLENSHGTIHPVGKLLPNAWGLFDMNGGVLQWCADRAGYYDSAPTVDPTGPKRGPLILRGSLPTSPTPLMLHAAFRLGDDPDKRGDLNGFRVARTIAP